MQTKQTHWASLLTLIVIGISAFFLILLITAMFFVSIMDLVNGIGQAAASMIGTVAFGFVFMLLLLCGWFVLEKTRGVEQADQPFKFPFATWMWIALPVMVVLSIIFGGVVTLAELPWLNLLILPFLTILVIVPPIWLLFGIASQGLNLGPRWRFFSILSLGMTVSPFIMVLLEMTILITIILGGSVYIAVTQPEFVGEIERLSLMVNETMNEEAMFAILAPYLTNPTFIAVVIGYIAVIVPLIEELLKPLAVWFFARQIESPAQGFALGVLSGAAFALVESLNASADGSMGWAVIVTARTGTSVLHMLTSGLVGWGIASAFKEKRIGRLFGAYSSAVLIHGIWNAAAAGAGISALGESIGKPEWVFTIAPALVCGLLVLGIGTISLLIAFNRRLHKQMEPALTGIEPALQPVHPRETQETASE